MATNIPVDPNFFDAIYRSRRLPGERLVGTGTGSLRLLRRMRDRDRRRTARQEKTTVRRAGGAGFAQEQAHG
jgi:S-adenosylmethionine:tRNA-ribosyltransferase-isomerase (queuine synthetase)